MGVEALSVPGEPNDLNTLARNLVMALQNQFGFPEDELRRMRPYLRQFLKDVRDGYIKLYDDEETPEENERQRRTSKDKETAFQKDYKPASQAEAVGTLVPTNMQLAIERSLNELQQKVMSVDEFVASKLGYTLEQVKGTFDEQGIGKPGYFSAEQVDALAMAINNVDRGAGFIIGDQTGVGKGRFVAGMIRYALQQGRIPIFVTARPGLYSDMYRDLRDIGMNPTAMVTNGDLRGDNRIPLGRNEYLESMTQAPLRRALADITSTGRLPQGYDVLFTTYSQMQYGKNGAITPRQPALEALAPNAFIILDESHEAGGSPTRRFDRQTGQPIPTRADFIRGLLDPAAGVVYSSATYAKNPYVMSLYFKTDIGLAVNRMDELAPLIESGGVPLQQVMSNMLVEAAQYARRERTWDGVNMEMTTVPAHLETAEQVSTTLRDTLAFDRLMAPVREAYDVHAGETGDEVTDDNAIGDEGVSSVSFASIMHNIISQSLMALKADQAVDHAIQQWRDGKKPILAVSSTFGSLLDQYIAEEHLLPGADMSSISFNKVFQNYLYRTRVVSIRDPHSNDPPRKHYIDDDELTEMGFGDLIQQYEDLKRQIAETDLSRMPGSPLDYMIGRMRAAGMRVGEITGRMMIVEDGVLTGRDSSEAAKKQIMNAFNGGTLDALLINRSGSTGFSLHANRHPDYFDFNENGEQIAPKPRHMIVMQADPNIDTFMQMLGRIHRTGQIHLPEYTLLVTDLPAEKRPASVLMRKMGSLNANTSANKESAISLQNVTDMMNEYGNQVAEQLLREDVHLQDALGIYPDDHGNFGRDVINKFTGRLAVLPVAQQEAIWVRAETNYKNKIAALDATGENALEAKTLNLEARTESTREITPDRAAETGVDSPFGRPAILERMSVKRLGDPHKWDNIPERIQQILNLDEATPAAMKTYADNMVTSLNERMVGYLDDLDEKLEQAREQQTELQEKVAEAEAEEEGLEGVELRTAKAKTSKLRSALDKVHRLEQRLTQARETGEASATNLATFINDHKPGTPVYLKVRRGDETEDFFAISMGITTDGRSVNPAARSAYTMHFAVADGMREVKVPLSEIGQGRKFELDLSTESPDQQRWHFEDAARQSGSRETRNMITGNLLAGFNAFRGKGQFVMYTDEAGNVRQGILLPRTLDADRTLDDRPVTLTPEQTVQFLEGDEDGLTRLVTSDDGKLRIEYMGRNQNDFHLSVQHRGGGPYHLNRAVKAILGPAHEFARRQGGQDNRWRATATPEQIGQILQIYADNLGTTYITATHKPEAQAIVDGPAAGLAEDRPNYMGGRAVNKLDDYHTFAADRVDENPHTTAQAWLAQQNRETGREHLAALDAAGKVTHAYTENKRKAVLFSPDLLQKLDDPTAGMVVHHNHPEDTMPSRQDLRQLPLPGLDTLIVHASNGDMATVRLAPELSDLHPQTAENRIGNAHDSAKKVVKGRLEKAIDNKLLTREQAALLQNEIINRALASAGLIEYASSRSTAPLPDHWVKSVVRAAAQAIGELPEDFDERVHRSAQLVRPDEQIGRLPYRDEGVPGERSGREAGSGRGEEGTGPTPEGGRGLAEERDPWEEREDELEDLIRRPKEPPKTAAGAGGGGGEEPPRRPGAGATAEPPGGRRRATSQPLDDAQEEIDAQAFRRAAEGGGGGREPPAGGGRPPPGAAPGPEPRGWFNILRRMLGTGRFAPGEGEHWFNFINRIFTTPMGKALRDPLSAAKWNAITGMRRMHYELSHKWRNMRASWRGAKWADIKRALAALEVASLKGEELPRDGSPISVTNDGSNRGLKWAVHSRPDEEIHLTPEQTRLVVDHLNAMDQIHRDTVETIAKHGGWEGEATARAIYEAANRAANPSERRRLLNLAATVATVEAQYRHGYVPFMREGNYYFRVRPNRPNENWTGEGFPPTEWFSLIQSHSWWEQARGGRRSGTPRLAEEELARLREKFGDGYDIEHGYYFRDKDGILDLDVTALEKLMMMANNDVVGQLRRTYEMTMPRNEARQKAQREYDEIVDKVLNKFFDEQRVGFRRPFKGTPGYDGDFYKNTSKYENWVSHYLSKLHFQKEMDAADAALRNHPDPETRKYWENYDRYIEEGPDQLSGPLAKMRQGAFYWLLGGNLATTAKILMHGPLRGAPILTTGLGGAGRTAALADYIKASKQMWGAVFAGKDGIGLDFRRIFRNLTADERNLFEKAEADGTIHSQTADELSLGGYEGEEILSDRNRMWQRVLNIWSSNVSAADRMVRGSMLLSAYRTANKVGMDRINEIWNKNERWNKTTEKTPENFARFMVDETVGVFGKSNRMEVARGNLGGALFQFRTYETGYLSNMHQMMTAMGPEGKVTAALMLGGLGMMGGAMALPFVDDIEKAAGGVWKMINGVDPDIEKNLKEAMDGLFGPGGGDVILHGMYPLGIDWSGLGFGDTLSKQVRSPMDIAGAAVSTFTGAPYRAWERARTEQPIMSIARELMPNAIKNAIGALYPETVLTSAATGRPVMSPEQLSTADRAKMAAGFHPEVTTKKYQDIRQVSNQADHFIKSMDLAENTIANLMAQGRNAEAQQAIQDAMQVMVKGMQAGVFTNREMQEFNSKLRQKIIQRMYPDLGSKMQQRVHAAQQQGMGAGMGMH